LGGRRAYECSSSSGRTWLAVYCGAFGALGIAGHVPVMLHQKQA